MREGGKEGGRERGMEGGVYVCAVLPFPLFYHFIVTM